MTPLAEEEDSRCSLQLSLQTAPYSFAASESEESKLKLDMISLSWHHHHDHHSSSNATLPKHHEDLASLNSDSEKTENHGFAFHDYLSGRDPDPDPHRGFRCWISDDGKPPPWFDENSPRWPKIPAEYEEAEEPRPPPVPSDSHLNFALRNIPRVCVDCKTSKTPLWRSGPQGPKSLCNACGIRYRKARRALAVLGDSSSSSSSFPKHKNKEIQNPTAKRRSDLNINMSDFKKRAKISSAPSSSSWKPRKSPMTAITDKHNEETPPSPTASATFNSVFARDEEEAAVLLMALSCGLVHV
eukprot:TRINITY_DN145_c0_g1_i1.p1 TRINITY_DN145_c0_g1~~TRINITY_DN145_c0_g1_i1.p1  ORF type:complete len:299 (+),score=3.25 TRINITY_DN145_c0_g1_i1:381-1277(+)